MTLRAYSDALEQDEQGIWRADLSQPVSYPTDGNETCFIVEGDSFWFKHRNRCIVSLVERWPAPEPGPLFDVGGGNGVVAVALESAGISTVLVEPGAVGAANGRGRGLRNVVLGTLESAAFRSGSLPSVGIFDVIEHIEDRVNFLDEVHRILVPGGMLYATVPAYGWLWSDEDVHAGHFLRYTVDSLTDELAGRGFEVDYCSYFFRPLPLPIFLLRSLPHRLGAMLGRRSAGGAASMEQEHNAGGGATRALVERLLEGEVERINAGQTMSFGASCLVAAHRVP